MLALVKVRYRSWHNPYADHPVLAATLDVSAAAEWRPEQLGRDIPAALNSELSGFPEEDAAATVGDLAARIALGLQRTFDHVPASCGAVTDEPDRRQTIFFAARDEPFARFAVRVAVSLAADIVSGKISDPDTVRSAAISARDACRPRALDPTSRAMVQTFVARGIPFFRINDTLRDLQSGQGAMARRSGAGLTDATSALALGNVQHKPALFGLLGQAKLPVADHAIAQHAPEAVKTANRLGLPVIVRPVVEGGPASAVLNDARSVRAAADRIPGPILVQGVREGSNHRLLLVDGRLVAGTRSSPGADVTDTVHPDTVRVAERAAQAIGLPIADIEFRTPDITRSWRETGGTIMDVGAGTSLVHHLTMNSDRDVMGPIVDTLFPNGDDGRIPTAMVTGTKGKSTTCNMLEMILRQAGHVTGKVTSDGVDVDGERRLPGDRAGPRGAHTALQDRSVTAAILETACGGLLRNGTYLEWCDAAALVNVDTEHVGFGGINTVPDMVALKRKVTDCARKAVVLNALCPNSSALIDAYPPERVIAFSLDPNAAKVRSILARGGRALVHRAAASGGAIAFLEPAGETHVCDIADLPAALGGLARHSIENAMATAGLAIGLGVGIDQTAAGLQAFEPTRTLSPARLNFLKGYPYQVLLDRAASPIAYSHIVPLISSWPVEGRRLCMFRVVGDRLESDFERMAQAIAGHCDLYVPYEMERFRRGYPAGALNDIMRRNLIDAGVSQGAIRGALDELEGMRVLKEEARPGDLAVILGSMVDVHYPALEEIFGSPE